jgi:hypothetical protein
MPHDEKTIQKFSAALQQLMREKNCSIIDPLIPELTLDAFEELVEVGAKVRGAYLKQYFQLAEKTKNELPPAEDLKHLRGMRELYEEMSAAYHALETAMGRGYVTIKEGEVA